MSEDTPRSHKHYPMYATALQHALASGDAQQLREAAERGRSEGGDDPEIRDLVRKIDAEIERLGARGS